MTINNTLDKYRTSGTLILIPKTEEYVKYVFQILIKIPRIEKFNIGSEIKTSALQMLEYAHFINKDRKDAYTYLNKIDALISYNRSMIRILNDEKFLVICNLKSESSNYKYEKLTLKYENLILSNYNVDAHKDLNNFELKPWEARLYKIN